MYKKLTFILFCFLTSISFSQTNVSVEKSLSVKYSEKEIQYMKETNIEKYNLYVKSFAAGVSIWPYDEKMKSKGNNYPVLNITVENVESFNYLEYNLDLTDNSQYYLVNNSKSLLLIRGAVALNQMK